MKNGIFTLVFFSLICLLFHCKSLPESTLSPLGNVKHPEDNLADSLKIELGKKLFFDKRLSLDETVSCATCHVPELAFTDGKQVSDGVLGRKTDRNSPSILNAGFLPKVMFDGELTTLEMQVIVPIQEHSEMGMKMGELIKKLKNIPEYQQAAQEIYKRDFDPWVLTRSIAAFERTLISDNSDFDKFMYQNEKASKDLKAGWKLFSEKLYCTKCHPAPYFTTFKVDNNGYTTLNNKDLGRFRIHGDSNDIGKFKVPSLRNVSITAPYMHDGKLNTLDEVIDHYATGGKNVINQSQIVQGFELTNLERKQLKLFLNSLTDFQNKF